MVRLIGGLVVGLILIATIVVVRDLTMTRHDHTPSDSRTVVVFRVETETAVSGDDDLADALLQLCEGQVDSRQEDDSFEVLGDRRYRAVLEPALDRYDERELEGCLEDRTMDHVQAVVEELERIDG